MQPGDALRANNGSWGAQLPLKQLTLLLLLFCCFLGFFLRCHVDLLTSYGSWLFVQTAFVSALPKRQSRFTVTPVLFPIQVSTLGAPILSYVQKKMQHFCKGICMRSENLLRVYRWNFFFSDRTSANFFCVRTNFRGKKTSKMQSSDEISTVSQRYGAIFSVAIS